MVAKRSKSASKASMEGKKVFTPIPILRLCSCTFLPYPHRHKSSQESDPWNWKETQAIWAEDCKPSRRVKIVNGELNG